MKILEFQRLVDEETQVDGLLYQSHWRVLAAFINDFLLATSVLCFYVQTYNNERDTAPGKSRDSEVELVDMDRIGDSLRTSQAIWNRQSASSREARKAVVAISYVLGGSSASAEPQTYEDALPSAVPAEAVSYFPGEYSSAVSAQCTSY